MARRPASTPPGGKAPKRRSRGRSAAAWWPVLLIVLAVVLLLWWWQRAAFVPAPPAPPGTVSVPPASGAPPPAAPKPADAPVRPKKPAVVKKAPRAGEEGVVQYTGYDFTRAPGFGYPAPTAGQQVVRCTGFTLSYCEAYEQAAWVAYELTADEARGAGERTDNFREDGRVRTGSAALSDYHKSGYDRGHLAPAGDMKWTKKAMSESFLLSNVSPQAPAFNRGVWNRLEQQTRTWAVANNGLYVVTGPLLEPGLATIGPNRVAVPRYYFKALLDARGPELKAIAFLLPNRGSKKPLASFVVTIDEVERRTGLDLFPQLPDALEGPLESAVSPSRWF